jgi:hypothetical protein
MDKLSYTLLVWYRLFFGYFYRGLKKLLRKASSHHIYTGCILEGQEILQANEDHIGEKPKKEAISAYKNKWSKKVSSNVPELFMHLYSFLSGVNSCDFVPDTLFFTHIEPMLNNVEYSRSFADKNMYSLLIDQEILPPVLLRKMHGTYLNSAYHFVSDVDKVLQDIAGRHQKVIIKHAVSSQGGDNVLIVKSDGQMLMTKNGQVDKAWIEDNFGDNFLIQAFVQQHSFYDKFNASSLNTFRVYTYRSVVDDSVHVMQSVLRVGGEGSEVDNISKGGRACGISSEGRLNGKVCDLAGNFFNQVGQVEIKKGAELFKYDQVVERARKLARKQFYTRLIGFDLCVDHRGEVKLIELNNYDVGVDVLQMCNGPLFREFTDEVIEYCHKRKKSFRPVIR